MTMTDIVVRFEEPHAGQLAGDGACYAPGFKRLEAGTEMPLLCMGLFLAFLFSGSSDATVSP